MGYHLFLAEVLKVPPEFTGELLLLYNKIIKISTVRFTNRGD
jgi:hypothetical protein